MVFALISNAKITITAKPIHGMAKRKGITALIVMATPMTRCIQPVIEVKKLLIGSIISGKNKSTRTQLKSKGFLKFKLKNLF